MMWKSAALLAAAVLAAGAAPKPTAPKPAPAKAQPVKAQTAKPVRDPTFDARNPSNLIEVLAAANAHGEIARTEGDGVMLKVTSPAGSFQAQFAGCDTHGRGCLALGFDASANQRTATLAEINRFNQSSVTCRIVQDQAGKPHMLFSTLLFAETSRGEMIGQIDGWRGCLADFGDFLKDPTGYLASAP